MKKILIISFLLFLPLKANVDIWELLNKINPVSYITEFFEDIDTLAEKTFMYSYEILQEIKETTSVDNLKNIKIKVNLLLQKLKYKVDQAKEKGKNTFLLEKAFKVVKDIKKQLKLKLRLVIFDNLSKQVNLFISDLKELPKDIIEKEYDHFYKQTHLFLKKILEENKAKIDLNNPYLNQHAKVSILKNICNEEKKVLLKRKPLIKNNLEKILDIKLDKDDVPNIAFCFSGGGYRAMIGTCGFLVGAEKIGLLDSALYISSLSGSTWYTSSWILRNISPSSFKDILKNKVSKLNLPSPKQIEKNILGKILYDQNISLVDIYGTFLTINLLKDLESPKNVFSYQKTILEDGTLPIPIYTAVEGETKPYEWFEFTPFYIGSDYINSYVPAWAFGRKFDTGHSQNFAPEFALGYFLGIFGSAFSVSMEDIEKACEEILKKKKYKYLKPFFDLLLFKDDRFAHTRINNFTKNLIGTPIKDQKKLILIDGGIGFNLPFPPLLKKERKIDIIFAFDISRPIYNEEGKANTLEETKKYAKEKDIKLPEMDSCYERINIFKDPLDPESPIIVYMPLINNTDININNITNLSEDEKKYLENLIELTKDFEPDEESFCNTLSFKYNNEEFEKLSSLGELNILVNKDKIYEILLEGIDKNKKLKTNKKRSILLRTIAKWIKLHNIK